MLGTDLCEELCGDYEVIGADVIASPAKGGTKQSQKCDITNKQKVVQVFKKVRPDAVIHAAAWTDVDGCELDPKKAYKINSEGAKNVALECKAAAAVLIYISTDFVFDGKKETPYKETDKTNPISVYGDSKLKGEQIIKKVLKKYFILRTSWLYGKHGKNFVDTILKIVKKEKCLKVVNDQIGSPTYTKDLAKGIHVLIDKSVFGTYHVSNLGSVSWFDYAKEILKLAKLNTRVIPISSQELVRPARRPAMSILDNSKFVKLTGYKMRNWQEALKEYVR